MKSRTTYSIGIVLLLTILLPRALYSYDPPEVFAVFTGEDQTKPFADDFCWIEDQNGDGCDELLVNNSPYYPGGDNRQAVNLVMFYWGGENMGDNVDVVFRTNNDRLGFGSEIIFLGDIIPDHDPFINIGAFLSNGGYFGSLYMYEAGEEIDNEVDFILSTPNDGEYSGIWSSRGRKNRPTDLNGDGYHDIIVKERRNDGHDKPLTVYFGGADLDTIPDWRIESYPWTVIRSFISGFDINGDGYDDIFIDASANYVFLGGDPMDTTAAFYFGGIDFECEDGPTCISPSTITMLQDVNDDGYDDWGVAFSDQQIPDEGRYCGYFVFFGGEEPDLEPDLELEGIHHGWIKGDATSISGGDFNGDGIGDIVTGGSDRAISDYGEICIYFGSRWIDGGAPDILIRNRDDDYEDFPNLGYTVGASGDYNGDGVDDIVVQSRGGHGEDVVYQLVILLGSEDWVVGVDEPDLPEEYKLSLEATPNPFNNSITISYQVPVSGSVKLGVYDIQGRLVEQLTKLNKSSGTYNTTWNCNNSGIYLLLMQTEDKQVVKKVVCIK
ncbi:MAG: T9SS type A sorting domain-containing protein [Calditrichaeota bacterium]|nr:T9SS type A sorting domain-containing protein [Calditrichota bacterium]